MRLAQTDRRAAEKRHDLGPATGPLLLARQREAQAEYDLEDIELQMRDAQADFGAGSRLAPQHLPRVADFDSQPLPGKLAPAVDELLRRAAADRPDLTVEGGARGRTRGGNRIGPRQYVSVA